MSESASIDEREDPESVQDIQSDNGPDLSTLQANDSIASLDGPAVYNIGDIVEVKYRNGYFWYRGTVQAVNKDQFYDVKYEGGDTETNIPGEKLRIPDKRVLSIVERFMADKDPDGYIKVGMVVEARFAGRDRWFKGEISRVIGNNMFDVIYDKGRKEAHNVKRTAIRLLPDEPSTFKHEEEDTTLLEKGTTVEARNEIRKLWSLGYIAGIHHNTITIHKKKEKSPKEVEIQQQQQQNLLSPELQPSLEPIEQQQVEEEKENKDEENNELEQEEKKENEYEEGKEEEKTNEGEEIMNNNYNFPDAVQEEIPLEPPKPESQQKVEEKEEYVEEDEGEEEEVDKITYDILYTDQHMETDIPRKYIRIPL